METLPAVAELQTQHGGGGGSGIAFAWEQQLLATPAPEAEPALVGSEA